MPAFLFVIHNILFYIFDGKGPAKRIKELNAKINLLNEVRWHVKLRYYSLYSLFKLGMINYDSLSDHELAALIKESDHRAYEFLYRRYFRLLFTHAYKKLRDKEQAKDVIQELFANLWLKREVVNFSTSISGYLFTAVNNKVIDHFLHKGVAEKYVSSFANFLNAGPNHADHRIREKQLADLIENEIKQLPSKMRDVFELSRKDHLTHKQIAEKLGISEKTVDRQISNALYRLKTKLGLFTFLVFLLKF